LRSFPGARWTWRRCSPPSPSSATKISSESIGSASAPDHQVLKKRRKQRTRFEAAIGTSYLIMSARSWSPFLSLASASSAITSYSCAISRRFRLPSSPMKMAAEARHPTASDRSHLIRFKISWLPRGISSDVSHDREKKREGHFCCLFQTGADSLSRCARVECPFAPRPSSREIECGTLTRPASEPSSIDRCSKTFSDASVTSLSEKSQ
jgi:hypothetical protein